MKICGNHMRKLKGRLIHTKSKSKGLFKAPSAVYQCYSFQIIYPDLHPYIVKFQNGRNGQSAIEIPVRGTKHEEFFDNLPMVENHVQQNLKNPSNVWEKTKGVAVQQDHGPTGQNVVRVARVLEIMSLSYKRELEGLSTDLIVKILSDDSVTYLLVRLTSCRKKFLCAKLHFSLMHSILETFIANAKSGRNTCAQSGERCIIKITYFYSLEPLICQSDLSKDEINLYMSVK